MQLKIGKKHFNAAIADNDERRARGLKGIRNLPKNSGMLLKWNEPIQVNITMQGVHIPLGLVFANDGKVQKVVEAIVDQPDIMIKGLSDMVFEGNMKELKGVKPGDNISIVASKEDGGKITFIEEEVPAIGELHVLDDKGIVQANLKGNERIFSRTHTKQLYSLVHQANKSELDSDYKKVGKAIARMITKQNKQEPEYVEE